MLYGSQHAAPAASILTGTEPVEERLQSVLQELQQQGQQSHQQRQQKHARSSSLSCWPTTDPPTHTPAYPCTSSGTHTSLAALSAKNRSGSFVPPGASPLSGIPLSILTTPLQGAINRAGPLRSSSSSFAAPAAPPSPTSTSASQATFSTDASQVRGGPTTDGATAAAAAAGEPQQRQPVHLDKKLSRSLGHARSILTGSSNENVLGGSAGCDGTLSTDGAGVGGSSAQTSAPTGLGGAPPPRLQGGGGGSILDRVSPQPQQHAFQHSLLQPQPQLLQPQGGHPSGSSMLLTGRAPSGEFTRSSSGDFVRVSGSSGVTGPKGSSGIGSGAPTLSTLFGSTSAAPAAGGTAHLQGAHAQQGQQQPQPQRRSPPSLLLQQLHAWDPHTVSQPSTTTTPHVASSSPQPWAAPTPGAPGAAPHDSKQPTPQDLTQSTPSPLGHPSLSPRGAPAHTHSMHSTPVPTPSPPKPALANGRGYDDMKNAGAAPSVERASSPTTSARAAAGAASPLLQHPSLAQNAQPHAHAPPTHTSPRAAAGAPPPQHRHKRSLSMCAALLSGAWDPAVDQPLVPQQAPLPHLQSAESEELLQQEGLYHQQQPQQNQHHSLLQQQQQQQQQPKSTSSSAATTTTNTTNNTVVLHDQLPPRLSQHEQQQGLHGLLQQAAAAAAASAQEQQQTHPQHSRVLPRPAPITAPPPSSYPPTSASTPRSRIDACSPTADPSSHLQDPAFSYYESPPPTPPAAATTRADAAHAEAAQHEREAHAHAAAVQHEREVTAQARAARLRQQHAATLEQQQGQRSVNNTAHATTRAAHSPLSSLSKGQSTPPPSQQPYPPPSTPERSVSAHATAFDSDALTHDDTDAAHANAAAYEGDLSASAACASALHAPPAPSAHTPTHAPTHARATTASGSSSSSSASAHHQQHPLSVGAPPHPRRTPLQSIHSGHEMLQDARLPSPPLTPTPSSPPDRPTSRTRSRSRSKIRSSTSTQALSAMRSPPSSAPTTAQFDRVGGSMGASVASSPASSALDAVLSPVALVNHVHSDRAATTGAGGHAHGSSSRPHSRRTTSSSGTGSLYSSREEEGGGTRLPRSTRDARDRRAYYNTSTDDQGSSHHSHSRSSMALLSGTAPQSNASSRMATMAATQRHRCPAAPVGTTAAVAAVTGRPNNEGASTPLTSTGVMMGGFNAISHSRVRSIDLATDMLLGGGRGGRGTEGSSSRLQHHSTNTQH